MHADPVLVLHPLTLLLHAQVEGLPLGEGGEARTAPLAAQFATAPCREARDVLASAVEEAGLSAIRQTARLT